jgi:hypothetical protein
MEKQNIDKPHIDPTINMNVNIQDPSKVELLDNLQISPEDKAKYLVPFLEKLWGNLATTTVTKHIGIAMSSFIDVRNFFALLRFLFAELVFLPARTHWIPALQSAQEKWGRLH